MDTNLFPYEIVSIEGQRYEGEASLINLKLSDGEIGIMKDHLPLVGIIAISHLTCIKNKEQKIFAISGGILNVTKKKVSILADAFEAKEEIDVNRAEQSKKRADERIKNALNDPNIDIKRAEASLNRALNRLEIASMK